MATGRMFRKELHQDLGLSELSKSLRYDVLTFHTYADDEGYILKKDALFYAQTNERALAKIMKEGFITIQNGIVKLEDWSRYQKIRIDRLVPSNIRHLFEGKDRGEIEKEWKSLKAQFESKRANRKEKK